jgi:hypothetical protein
MSGTGKSTALAELRKRGFDVVDTDEGGWTEWSTDEDGYVWREDRIAELLARDRDVTLYVSGTVSKQGRLYPHFDAVVLLSAPADVLSRSNRPKDDERLREDAGGARADPRAPGGGRAAATSRVHARDRRVAADRGRRVGAGPARRGALASRAR